MTQSDDVSCTFGLVLDIVHSSASSSDLCLTRSTTWCPPQVQTNCVALCSAGLTNTVLSWPSDLVCLVHTHTVMLTYTHTHAGTHLHARTIILCKDLQLRWCISLPIISRKFHESVVLNI